MKKYCLTVRLSFHRLDYHTRYCTVRSIRVYHLSSAAFVVCRSPAAGRGVAYGLGRLSLLLLSGLLLVCPHSSTHPARTDAREMVQLHAAPRMNDGETASPVRARDSPSLTTSARVWMGSILSLLLCDDCVPNNNSPHLSVILLVFSSPDCPARPGWPRRPRARQGRRPAERPDDSHVRGPRRRPPRHQR